MEKASFMKITAQNRLYISEFLVNENYEVYVLISIIKLKNTLTKNSYSLIKN